MRNRASRAWPSRISAVRVGVAGQKLQRGVAVVRAQYASYQAGPSSSMQGVKAGIDRGAALDDRGTRILISRRNGSAGPSPGVVDAILRVQQRQPGQQLGVDPVVFGVLGVVLTQVSGLGGGHHHHLGAAPTKPRGNRQSRRFGSARLPPSASAGSLSTADRPTPAPARRAGEERAARSRPNLPSGRASDRLVRSPAGHVDSQRQFHRKTLLPLALSVDKVTDRRGHGPDILASKSPHPRAGSRFPNKDTARPDTKVHGRPLKSQGSPRVPVGPSDLPVDSHKG